MAQREVIITQSVFIPAEWLEELKSISTATASYLLFSMGIRRAFMTGVFPLAPGQTMAGFAVTLRYIPAREDLVSAFAGRPSERPQRRMIDNIKPHDVLVIDARSELNCGVLGDVLAARVKHLGGAGIVTDGAMRDSPAIRQLGLPVYVRGVHGLHSTSWLVDVDMNVPIGCGGVAVVPGDVLLGDDEGVVVIPRHLVQAVISEGKKREDLEAFIRRKIEQGYPTSEVYPPNEATMKEYEAWRQAH